MSEFLFTDSVQAVDIERLEGQLTLFKEPVNPVQQALQDHLVFQTDIWLATRNNPDIEHQKASQRALRRIDELLSVWPDGILRDVVGVV